MRVCFFSNYSTFYGANISMYNLILDLRERYQIEPMIIYTIDGKDGIVTAAQKDNIKTLAAKYKYWVISGDSLNTYHRARTITKNVRYNLINIKDIKDIEKSIREFHPDIIHINNSCCDLGAVLALKLKIPYIWHVREFGYEDYNLRYIYPKLIVSRFYNKSDTVIAISDAIEEYYKKKFPKSNIKKVYNGIRQIDVIKKTHSMVTFCCVGLLQSQKNQLEILKAISILKHRGITDIKLFIVGDGDSKYQSELLEFVQSENIKDLVEFTGYQNPVTPYLEMSDIGIMSSVNEAFGRTTVEYMFAAMPVIGTNSGGTKEIIEDGVTGFLYESGNPMQLAEKMLEFINNKNLINSMGNAGRNRAKEKFSLESNTDAIYKIYEETLIKRKK